MRRWWRYLSSRWEPGQEREPEEAPEDCEQLPPATARRVLGQPKAPASLRQRAARLLQGIVGNRALASQPLPAATRERLEDSLGTDLSSVRLYHDEAAAQALGARAFTTGDQIVLAKAADVHDLNLLGHETAHIVQEQERGAHEGISKPGGATEHDARRAARDVQAGQAIHVDGDGPVPAVQRQEQRMPAPGDPFIRRESVRIMLFFQYRQQGAQGAFALTPELQSELARLIPDLRPADLARLWTPEPAGPTEAFERLVRAGYLPLFTAAPELTPPTPEAAPEPEPESRVVPFGMGMVGFHYRLNPRVPPPIGVTIRQHLTSRAIPLTYRQVDALLAGREQGVRQIETILRSLVPGLGRDERTQLAETVADVLLDASLQGQLKRETPTALERTQQRLEALEMAQGNLPSLLERLPVGASITIYF
jgi:hypothetical protein